MSMSAEELLADWKRQHIELSKGPDADKAQKEHDKLKTGMPFKRKEWVTERIKKTRWCIFMPENE